MDIVKNFKQALKIREVLVDNNVFQLHYRATALMLLICAGLVASKQHFGDPIDCITRDEVPNNLMDTYCWIHATFTLPAACNKTVGVEVAHPCVDKYSQGNEERVYHKYYQWVYFVLFFQAAFFYAPHFFWKSCESKLLSQLTSELRDPLFKQAEKKDNAMQIVHYLHRRRNTHQRYFHTFVLFELSNFANVILQMYVVDQFLGGTFTSYGLDVINYSHLEQDDRVDPMVRVFPRMTKCIFHMFGPSGDVKRHDALCILPLNIINEKIYIMMWFWFVFLAIVTGLWLVYRALTFVKPKLRLAVLERRASLTDSEHLQTVLHGANTSEWFLLCMMCKNMDSQWYRFIVSKYAARLKAEIHERRRCNGSNGYKAGDRAANGASGKRRPGEGKELMLYEYEYDDDQSMSGSDIERGIASEAYDERTGAESNAAALQPPDGVAVVGPGAPAPIGPSGVPALL